jgi:hypothetical protein
MKKTEEEEESEEEGEYEFEEDDSFVTFLSDICIDERPKHLSLVKSETLSKRKEEFRTKLKRYELESARMQRHLARDYESLKRHPKYKTWKQNLKIMQRDVRSTEKRMNAEVERIVTSGRMPPYFFME